MKQLYLRFIFAILLLFTGGEVSAQLTAACSPTYTSGSSSWNISSFSIGSFSHSPSYSTHDYTATQSFTVTAGSTYSVTVVTNGWCGVSTAADFNNNGVLDDPGELLTNPSYIATNPATYTFNITIPPTVLSGSYRFRVFNKDANSGAGTPAGSPCGTYGYGSWADYTVVVVNNATCQPPSSVSVSNIQPSTADLSWTAPSTTSPVGYFWKVVNQGDDPDLVPGISGYTSSLSATVMGLSSATNYQVYVKSDCGSLDSSAWMLPQSFGTPCSGIPNATTATGPTSVCSGVSFNLTATGMTVATGITYQWQAYNMITSTWDSIGNTANFTVSAGISTATDFRFVTTCANGGAQDISNTVSITINAPSTCYCTPGGTNSNYYINNFSTTGGVQDISNMGSGYSTGGYGDFTSMDTLSILPGNTFTVNAGYGSGSNTFGTKIWIDFDGDGNFTTAGDQVYGSSSYMNTLSTSITIPVTATPITTRMRIGISYTPSTGPATPCSTISGEFEDYIINIMPLIPCSGTPAVTTASGPSGVCANASFTLTATGYTTGSGLTYQWQQYNPITSLWDSIGNTPIFVVSSGITAATDYRFVTTCTNGGGQDISNTVSVSINQFYYCYCTPVSNCTNEGIDSVSFDALNHTSAYCASGGYSNYDNLGSLATIQQAQVVAMAVKAHINSNPASAGVWIDFDHSGTFDATEYTAFPNAVGVTPLPSEYIFSGNVTIPATAMTGITRMRVRSANQGGITSTSACNTGSVYGEYEDYLITINAGTGCTGTPTAGTASGPASVCSGIDFTLNASGYTNGATGLTYQWQQYNTITSTWDSVGNTPNFIVVGGITAATDYRFVVTCANGGGQDISNTLSITMNAPTSCYCIPTGTSNSSYGINNFSTSGAPGNINNLGSGLSSGGYGTFLMDTLTTYATNTVNFSASWNGSGTHGFAMWIDWNQNGSFSDPGELIYNTTGYVSSVNNSFVVPSTATLGATRMRIVANYLNSNPSGNPCSVTNASYAEWEDYTVNVAAPPSCVAPQNIVVSSILATTATASWNQSITMPGIGYEWRVFPQGSGPTGTATTTGFEPAGDTIASITGLTATTAYDFYVRSVCGVGDTSLWNQTNFTTACATFTAPYVQDVESQAASTNGTVGLCWSNSPTGSSSVYRWDISGSGTTPSSGTGPTSAHSGSKFFYTEASYGSSGSIAELTTPVIDVTGLTLPTLEFYYHMYGATMGKLVISASSDGITYTPIDSLVGQQQTNQTDPWLVRDVALTGYNVNTLQIKFTGTRGSSFTGDMSIDDISFIGSPLAIKLTDISATNVETRNRVDWTTGSESNGDYFIVERSADGRNYKALGTVNAKGTASNYSYWDENPYGGINYYRLKMMDASGNSTYSKVVTATVKGNGAFTVDAYPNPVSNDLTVKVYGNVGNNAMVTITDVTGKVVKVVTVENNKATISMSELAAGMYLVKYTDDSHSQILKVNKK